MPGGRRIVATLFDQLKAFAGFSGRRNDARSAGGNERRDVDSKYQSEGVERRRLVFVRALDFTLARLIHMMVIRMIVMMGIKMGMDDQRVNTVAMDMLKRRQNKGGCKRETAMQR
jgi:hypothetical protein